MRTYLKSKIYRATVTHADIDYKSPLNGFKLAKEKFDDSSLEAVKSVLNSERSYKPLVRAQYRAQ